MIFVLNVRELRLLFGRFDDLGSKFIGKIKPCPSHVFEPEEGDN